MATWFHVLNTSVYSSSALTRTMGDLSPLHDQWANSLVKSPPKSKQEEMGAERCSGATSQPLSEHRLAFPMYIAHDLD
jgi:hypothetical protein